MLLANRILLILYIFNKPDVWYLLSLKILAIKMWFQVNSTKSLHGRHFVVSGPKNFKLLPDSFGSGSQKIVLLNLLLFLCACYSVDVDHVQWNKVATLTARKWRYRSRHRLLYLHFSNMMNLECQIECQHILFWKRASKKTEFFHFFKGLLFLNLRFFW